MALGAVACDRPDEPPPPRSEAPAPSGALPADGSIAPSAQPPAPVAGTERAFVTDAAANGVAEVEASQLVASRVADARIKAYAEQVERERRAINDELQRIAAAKGVDVPATAEGPPRERLNRVVTLAGENLGRAYLQEFGIEAHRESIDLFERQAREGVDAELREFAERSLPTLREHLEMAQQIQSGATQGGDDGGGAADGKSGGGSS